MFNIFQKRKIIVTHDGGFHADDVFGCAALSLLLDGNIKILRSRDPEIIKKGEYVLDIGGIYDEEKNLFDHHQKGGAGRRPNGIEYASFGLVWKKFGAQISGSREAADTIDKILVSAIDANDNGMNVANNIFSDAFIFRASDLIGSFNPTGLEDEKNIYDQFMKAVSLAKDILGRQIKIASDRIKIEKMIREAYDKSQDKRMVVMDRAFRRVELMESLQKLPEPIFVVYPNGDGRWRSTGVLVDLASPAVRKNFPAAWAGLRDEELAKVSGVADAQFCHRALFTIAAKTKEGAIKMTQLALKA
jgi:uncharacterized UPF0160 family protein